MLLYAVQVTSRLCYTAEFIGKEFFKQPFQIINDKEAFINYTGPKINYGLQALCENEFWIWNADLLFEKNIRPQVIHCFETNGYKAFFKNPAGDLPFDIFAAAFYLLSRYEEYLPYKADKHGRYPHTASLAWKEGFIHLPLINIWLKDLKQGLIKKFQGLDFCPQSFTFIPTYDIDIAWSYLNKGWYRNVGGLLKHMVKGAWKKSNERIAVLRRSKKDPYDAYNWLHELHSQCGVKAYYFFLVAVTQNWYDKNILPSNKALQHLIKSHAVRDPIGIHPSWQSGDNEHILDNEIRLLEQITGSNITSSRQHYIRFTLPRTYRKLIRSGITKDYSMGYGGTNGFRASVSSSFNWYDLQQEEKTSLLIYPFCFMDACAYHQQKLTPKQAYEQMISYYEATKNVEGLMITIWHNQFLGTDPEFTGWKEVYEKFFKKVLMPA